MDAEGNLAVGYSTSSATTYPRIDIAGRLATDPLGQLAQDEVTMFAGAGSQTSASQRWGDYSSMTVDPVDDCTFWYTNEYYSSTSAAGWKTRIGHFKFPSCGANGVLTIDDVTVGEGDAGTSTATFTVTADPAPTSTVTVNVATENGTATAPGDYAAASVPSSMRSWRIVVSGGKASAAASRSSKPTIAMSCPGWRPASRIACSAARAIRSEPARIAIGRSSSASSAHVSR